MTTTNRCPNPRGCDGELYARADGVPGQWCPKCGYVFRQGGSRARCPNPAGCDGELYARADGVPGQWCPKCGFRFEVGSASAPARS